MAANRKIKPHGPWSAEEIARNEQADRVRALGDREQAPAQRLLETLRLSRFLAELREGRSGDVRAR